MAIGIKVKKAGSGADPGASRFFGDPAVPGAWVDNWSDDVIFFCQIRLSDIADLDVDGRLPHTGYLYIFLDTEVYPYTPMVYLLDGEPDTVIDGFNEAEPRFPHLCEAWEMEFFQADDSADGTRLFGFPSDWSYGEPAPRLFMQYDPLGADMGFLSDIDGFAYIFFADDEEDTENMIMHIERS